MTAEQYDARLEAIAEATTIAVLTALAAFVASLVEKSAAAEAIAVMIARANSMAANLADAHMADELSTIVGKPVLAQGITRPTWEVDRLTAAASTVLDNVAEAQATPTEPDRQDDDREPEPPRRTEPLPNTARPARAADTRPAAPRTPEARQPDARPSNRPVAPERPSRPPTREAEPTSVDEVRKVEGSGRVERLAKSEPLQAAAEATEEIVKRSPLVVAYTREVSANACERCIAWAEGGRRFPAKRPFPRHNGCTCKQIPITKKVEGK